MALEALPLTASGKTDRKALPDPLVTGRPDSDYTAPRNELEAELASIWAELLEIERVGIDDNFFSLGGHSLLATRLVAMVRMRMNIELAIQDVFTCPVLVELANYIDSRQEGRWLPVIERASQDVPAPLSYGQERLWFIDHLQGSVGYHLPTVLPLWREVDTGLLERTLRTIVERHEVLRTVIREQEGVGYQQVRPAEDWSMGQERIGNRSQLTGRLAAFVSRPFDLSADYMVRACVFEVAESDAVLAVVLHHIASDGWSSEILEKEFWTIYRALRRNEPLELEPLPLQYRDYAVWQRRYLSGEYLEQQLAYWEQRLAGTPALQLPMDAMRPAEQSLAGEQLLFLLNEQLGDELRKLCREEEVTMYMLLLSAFVVLLQRYTGQDDICVGTPVANRTQRELEGMIGFFVNTLVIRSDAGGDPAFEELLGRVRQATLDAYDHQQAPFEKVVERVVKERDWSRNPLFQVLFTLENKADVKAGEETRGTLPLTMPFDLSLTVEAGTEGGIGYRIGYPTELFGRERIARMGRHYEQLLRSVVSDRGQNISRLSLLTKEEEITLAGFNQTAVEYPERTVIGLFEEQVDKTPDAMAVAFEGRTLTYRELNEQANRLAYRLRHSRGIGREDRVGVLLKRSERLIVALLGIWKAGAVYVPIDAGYPDERKEWMISDSGCKEVIDQNWMDDWNADESPENAGNRTDSGDAAYVIYTSGSTGRPKGVMVEHGNLGRFMKYIQDRYGRNGATDMALVASTSFDIHLFQLGCALMSGGCCRICGEEEMRDMGRLLGVLKNVNSIDTVPAVYRALAEELESAGRVMKNIDRVFIGGDAIGDELLVRLRGVFPAAQIVVTYGPTEGTIFCTDRIYEVSMGTAIGRGTEIGRPIANVRIHVLDAHGQPAPVGVPGEIGIAGAGVARGYLNQVEPTAAAFVEYDGGRLYRTGDRGRWLPDGSIEFLGRKDEQVKIRGFRIEPGEIESALAGQAGVKGCCVVVREGRLVGYVVTDGGLDIARLEAGLSGVLPEYMVPRTWMELEAIPLTSNGKIDRKALSDLSASGLLDREYIAPRSGVEAELAAIWAGLLRIERVGIHDNFFALGGDSILSLQVVSRARKTGIVLRPRDLFEHQTIAGLAAHIRDTDNEGEQGLLEGTVELLPIQRHFFEQGYAQPWHHNQSILLRIEKGMSSPALEQLAEGLLRQHDSLRFRYVPTNDGYTQVYGPMVKGYYEENGDAGVEAVCTRYQESLNLEEGPLFKMVLIRTGAGDGYDRLLLLAHHLVVDGVSWRVLLEDMESGLSQLRAGGPLVWGRKTNSYREYADLLQQFSGSKLLAEEERRFWRDVVAGCAPLRTDKESGQVCRISEKGNHTVRLAAGLTEQLLKEMHSAYQTEINDVLLTALGKVLSGYQGNASVVFGLEGHGREAVMGKEMDISRTVGWFTNIYPVRLAVEREAEPGDLLRSVKEQLRGIPGKGMGYGVLRYLHGSKEVRDSLYQEHLYDVVFNYLGQLDSATGGNGTMKAAPEGSGRAMGGDNAFGHRLSVNAFVAGGELVVNWSYDGLRYEEATISGIAQAYVRELETLIVHCRDAVRSYTPSDFGLPPTVGYKQLEEFVAMQPGVIGAGDLYVLSGLQEGLLFHGLYSQENTAYITQHKLDVGRLDADVVRRCWEQLMQQHTILRTSFHYTELSVPVQRVHAHVSVPIAMLDLQGLSPAEQSLREGSFLKEDLEKGFDFSVAPLMRISIVKLADDNHRLIWTMHHILLDGWSLSLVMGKFLLLYRGYAMGQAMPAGKEDRFEDYIKYIHRLDPYKADSFWREYLKDQTSPALLPFITSYKERNSGNGTYHQISLEVGAAETSILKAFSQQHQLTINTLVQGAWALLLSEYCGQQDVVYGVSVSGRPADLPGMEQRIGLYINMLPLRSKVPAEMGVVEWLTELQSGHSIAREYQYGSLRKLQQRYTAITGDWFDSMIAFENYPISETLTEEKATGGGFEARGISTTEHTNYPLTITVSSGDSIHVQFNYNSDLLSDEYAHRIKGHFGRVLTEIGFAAQKKTGELSLLTAEEETTLEGFNRTELEVSDKTLVELFEEQAGRTPDAVAALYEGQTMTYGELNEQSNRLAFYLRELGIGPEMLVPVCMERSAEMLVAILGIWKAGGAYVPVDPAYPAERIKYMLEDTGAAIVVSNSRQRHRIVKGSMCSIVEVDESRFITGKDISSGPPFRPSPARLAYVIYTSGSTGRPKGAMIEHRGMLNHLYAKINTLGVNQETRIAQTAALTFDISVWQMFAALVCGGTTIIYPDEVVYSGTALLQRLEGDGITIVELVPSYLSSLLEGGPTADLGQLTHLLVTGEAASPGLLKKWTDFYPGAKLVNAYGPTEASDDICHYEVKDIAGLSSVPIGRPIQNMRIYIVDDANRLSPIGVPGEIWVAGIGVGRGYWRDEKRTALAFAEDPFCKKDGERLYRTGDLGRWLPDGNIEFLGRRDEQVKVRGYRIELGEIESVLSSQPGVKGCCVMAREERLVSYVVMDAGLDKRRLEEALSRALPEYMVPRIWVQLEALPLLSSGKVDRKSLPDPLLSGLPDKEYTAPRNALEEQLAAIWSDLLRKESISVLDNFFELGGDSLLVIRLVARVRNQMNIELSVKAVFDYPSIESMALYINLNRQRSKEYKVITKI